MRVGNVPEKVLLADPHKCGFLFRKLAFKLWEDFFEYEQLIVIGVQTRGYKLAQLIATLLKEYSGKKIQLYPLDLNNNSKPEIDNTDLPAVLIDDVIHTGKTMLQSLSTLKELNFKILRTLVLVDRMTTRLYPVHPDIAGIRLATTWHDFVEVIFEPAPHIWLKSGEGGSRTRDLGIMIPTL